jgi:hypothetical protein
MPQVVGDGGGDSDAADLAFEYNDTAVASTAGTITFRLTYEPVEESLHVRWGELNVSAAYFTLDGQTVIINDPHIHVGDEFTAAYAYYPTEEEFVESFTLRGYTGGQADSSVPLPGGTEVGDTMVVIVINQRGWAATISDTRLHLVDSRPGVTWGGSVNSAEVWMGTASDLSNLASSAPSSWPLVFIFTFAEQFADTSHAATMDVGGAGAAMALPTLSVSSALLILVNNNDTVVGQAPATSAAGYTLLANQLGVQYQTWSVYGYIGDPPTPSGVTGGYTAGDIGNGSWALAIGVTGL